LPFAGHATPDSTVTHVTLDALACPRAARCLGDGEQGFHVLNQQTEWHVIGCLLKRGARPVKPGGHLKYGHRAHDLAPALKRFRLHLADGLAGAGRGNREAMSMPLRLTKSGAKPETRLTGENRLTFWS
jgi:hypothetical protein